MASESQESGHKPITVIAVVYENDSGIGDIGKHVILQALQKNIHVRAISAGSSQELGTVASFTDTSEALDEKFAQLLTHQTVDIENMSNSDSRNTFLDASFKGVDAVVSCACNRQPGHGRHGDLWMKAIVHSMLKNDIKNIVVASSCGIGTDWPPMRYSWVGCLFSLMFVLPGVLRSAYSDLDNMETTVSQRTNLRSLILRPLGLDPSTVPRGVGFIHTLPPRATQPALELAVAKEDVAAFALKELLEPSFSNNVAVTLGYLPKDK